MGILFDLFNVTILLILVCVVSGMIYVSYIVNKKNKWRELILFKMEGCPACVQFDKELNKGLRPKIYRHGFYIREEVMPGGSKPTPLMQEYGIQQFPTLVYNAGGGTVIELTTQPDRLVKELQYI